MQRIFLIIFFLMACQPPNPPPVQAPSLSSSLHPKVLLNSLEKNRLQQKLVAPDAATTRFKEMVDRAVSGISIYGYEGWWSALFGQLTGEARYCTDAVTRGETWLTSEATRTSAGQRASVAGDSYLEIGEIVGNLMLTYDFCFDTLSLVQRLNWRNYAKQAVWNVWNHTQANWGASSNAWKGTLGAHPWSGWSVNDPVNNYYYSFLQATMLLALAAGDEDPEIMAYRAFFRTTKIQNELVPIFASQLKGGGSREGTGYGTAQKNLFRLYYFWERSTGERLTDLTPHAFDTMAYTLHAITPSNDRLAPIGDHARDETAQFFDYHRELLLTLSALYPNTALAARVNAELPNMTTRVGVNDVATGRMRYNFNYIWDFLYENTSSTTPINLNTVYHASGTGHIFARSGWNSDATWLGFMAGAYTQSHAHQDGLSVLVFKNQWLVHDLNMNLPSGIEQSMNMHASLQLGAFTPSERPDSSAALVALQNTPELLYLNANQGTLYSNQNVKLERQVIWLKPNALVLCDQGELANSGTAQTATLRFPLPTQASISGNSASSAGLQIFWQAGLNATQNAVGSGHRLELSQTQVGMQRLQSVLSLAGAVSSVDFTSTTQVNLSDGRKVQVDCGLDGFVAFSGSSGQETSRTVLTRAVQVIPLGQ